MPLLILTHPVPCPGREARASRPGGWIGGALALLGAALLLGCNRQAATPPQPTPPDVVAVVDGEPITQADLAAALARRMRATGIASSGDERASATLRQEALEELVRDKVLLTKARAAGVDRDPELVRRWERMVVARYESAHKPDPAKRPLPTPAEVEEYYRSHAADFQRPERIRVALIQIKAPTKATPEKRAQTRERAGRILALALEPGAGFPELARLHSEDRGTRYSGGDSGWIERGRWPEHWPADLAPAAFAIPAPGALAPLVEAGGSFYVLKLLERQPAGTSPLAEVRDRIAHRLHQQQTLAAEQRFHAEQRAGLKVEINTAAVEAVPLPAPTLVRAPGEPPALPAN